MSVVKIGIKSARRAKAAQRLTKACIEALEIRTLLSVNVLTSHNDTTGSGANTAEIQLTPTNVKTGSFGKLFTTALDGQVYAQPLVDTGVTINGTLHNAVFVATENDSLYAIDTGSGAVLWKRSFLTLSDSSGILNNTLGATAISTVASSDVFNNQDISPTLGITGTPVIDSARNLIYLVALTKEVVGGNTYFVQRLHAINIADGTDACTPYVIGTTTGSNNNTNSTQIYVYGNGDGYVVDPYNGTGRDVVQFNALTENQRPALTLVNNNVYVAWASHGDNGPYHGWIVSWNVSNVTTSGFALSGVLNTCPNNGEDGVWQGGGGLVWEPNGSAFYFLTGNGNGEAPTLGSNGLPVNANYNEALVKAVVDPTTSPTNQNPNGWGIKITDFFIPSNVAALDGADSDFGSGAPILLPNPVTINGVSTNVIVVGGKDGRLFVLNRNNLGHYNATYDAALNAAPGGTVPVADSGTLSQPAFYNGDLYVVSGYSGDAYEFSVSATGTLTTVSQTNINFGYEPGGPSVSSNGTSNGIVWIEDRNTNELHAYNASSLNQELWNSSQASGDADAPGAIMKFGVPTIANGEVFVATTNSLVVYGLTPAANSVPVAPVLSATPLSGSAINLTWTDSTVLPNLATAYLIQESTDGVNFTQVTTAPAGATSIGVGGLNTLTKYYFRILGTNNIGNSSPSNIASATTTSQSSGINFSSGFASTAGLITLNGSAALNGSNLELTNGNDNEASSAFSLAPVTINQFNTTFTFQISAGNTADGMTFTLQNNTANALGGTSGALGYQGISNSIAIKFDLYNNSGEGSDSTGLFSGGAIPTNVGSVDLSSTGINLHSGDPTQANLSYNGTVLTVVLTDTVTNATATQTYTVNIPSLIGSTTAYAGFTAGTGGLAAVQNILNWTLTPGGATSSPNAPTGLGATPATATSITLNWTNNALNQTGYHLDRATDSGFTQNLITETLPATPSSYTDTTTGLAPGQTYYYRIRAFNSVGDSGNSNVASVSIPVAPPKATNQSVTGVSSTEIDLSWQDNAGHAALGYHILRAANNGTFVLVATLPPTSRTAPSTYTYADTNLTPGTFYEYHIQAYNTSGYNDFAGTNATTLTAAPSGLTASQGSNGVTLSWSAPMGAVSYNVYRGITSGGESAIPIVTGVTSTTYQDPVSPGTIYYYEVTAVNANATDTPPLPAESARSAEASTAPTELLTGAPIGTGGSYDGTSTIAKVFDGNLATYFDAPTAGTAGSPNWVGLDLGAAYTISSITYAPRVGFESRMVGGYFQGSNDPTFTTGDVTLAGPITTAPADGSTTIPSTATGSYRYVRYVSPAGGYGNIAELQFTGSSATSAAGPTVTTAPAATLSATGITAALTVAASETGNPALTYTWSTASVPAGVTLGATFSSSNGTTTGNAVTATFAAAGIYMLDVTITDPSNNSIVVPLTVNVAQVLTSITIYPAATPVSVPAGGTENFTAVGNDQFADDMDTQPTFTWSVATGGAGSINSTTGVYIASTTVGSTATVTATAQGSAGSVVGSALVKTIAATATTLSGTPIGTAGSYDGTSTIVKAFDGNLTTYFDAPTAGTANSPNWVGLDLGSTYAISSIAYAPRAGFESRMVGGYFQASNDPTFTTGDVTLGTTITAAPADGYTTMANSTTGAYRYVRYVSPAGGYGNIAELQFAGTPASSGTGPTLTTQPAATLSTSGASAALTVAASETGNPALTYTWSVSTLPTGVTAMPTFSSTNGTTSGNATTITFPAAGTYGLSVKVADPSSNSATATLSVVVTQLLTSISITPASPVSVVVGTTQAFSASALDQFGLALATQPTFTWSIATGGAGSINTSTGQYTASATVGSTATVTATSGAISGTASVTTTAATQTPTNLTGTPIGTSGSYDGVSTITKVFDGNLNTYFDASTAGTAGSPNWVGLDLGSTYTISSILFAPRIGYEYRMEGGIFQGSNSPTFATATTLYVVPSTSVPLDNYTTITSISPGVPISSLGAFRYVRYLAPAGSYGNIAELQFTGVPATGSIPTTPTTPGTPTLTYATSTTAQIVWAPSTDSAGIAQYSIYRNGVLVGTSGTPTYTDTTLTPGAAYAYTIVATDAASNNSTPSSPLAITAPASITGTPIGTLGSYDGVSTIAKVFDGNLSTYFDAPTAGTASSPNWVGLDLGAGTPDTITAISFAPRLGFESRMVGGVFQESNDPTFTTGVVTLATITTTPLDGFTTVAVAGQTGFRYIRYLAPAGSYGNIAEIELFGMT